jgi:hypothetical protein
MPPIAGTRLRCEVCGSEAIVITAHEPVLTCCGQPLTVMTAPAAAPETKNGS